MNDFIVAWPNTWMWEAGVLSDNDTLSFARGGFQGGEGEFVGAEWYIENVFEEISIPNEYFYENDTGILYYYYNNTDSPNSAMQPPSNTTFVATKLRVLFNYTGTQANPVKNMKLQGVTLTDARYTFMDTHGLPSGGDWAIQRTGAVFAEGTEGLEIDSCHFDRLDGIGIFLSGYNRGTIINGSDFEWIGDSAIASWGYTSGDDRVPGGGPDGREGDQPRGTIIRGNVANELGIWEKQSSFYFQATSTQTQVLNNIFFNGPRAGVNFNDGFGGQNLLKGNLLANWVRESGDHGPWNSWDRVPYITTIKTGKPSIIPDFNEITKNFIIGTYETQEAIDTDDGSSYYLTHDNFFMYGGNGLKSDFEGHDNHHFRNIYGYIGTAYHLPGNDNDQLSDNRIVLTGANSGYSSTCHGGKENLGVLIYGNSVYTQSGQVIVCGDTTLKEWTAQGYDPGSTCSIWPSDDEIIQWGRDLFAST